MCGAIPPRSHMPSETGTATMLRWFPTFQVATTCFSCSPPDLNFLDPYFISMYMHNLCQRVTDHLQFLIHTYIYTHIHKGKVIPLQARCDPEGR